MLPASNKVRAEPIRAESALWFGFVFTILSFAILSFCQGRFFTGNQLSRLGKKQRWRKKKKKTKNEK